MYIWFWSFILYIVANFIFNNNLDKQKPASIVFLLFFSEKLKFTFKTIYKGFRITMKTLICILGPTKWKISQWPSLNLNQLVFSTNTCQENLTYTNQFSNSALVNVHFHKNRTYSLYKEPPHPPDQLCPVSM